MAIEDYYSKEEALTKDYKRLKLQLEKWGKVVHNHIISLMEGSSSINKDHIEIFPKARLKEDTSLIRKAFYRNKETLADPLLISDKIATRIVVTTREDIEPIKSLIL